MRTALSDLRKKDPPERAINAAALDLAELELQNELVHEAEARLRQLENIVDGGRQGPQGLRAQMLRGVALMQMGRLTEAEPLLRQIVEARRKMYGDDNVWTGEARLYLGICLHRAGKLDEGQTLIRLGRVQFSRESSENHFVVRLADNELRRKHG